MVSSRCFLLHILFRKENSLVKSRSKVEVPPTRTTRLLKYRWIYLFVAGSARESGLVWRGCSAGSDAEDGAAGALTDGNANPGDKVSFWHIMENKQNSSSIPISAVKHCCVPVWRVWFPSEGVSVKLLNNLNQISSNQFSSSMLLSHINKLICKK